MQVRMKDIAKDLNVSVVTVSKVLRNQGDISPATRRRVLKRAKELNYQPNWVARSLVTRKTYIIGLVVPDLMHSFFAEVAKGIANQVRPHGYNVLISNSEEDPELETSELNLLLARQVDGLIVASAQPLDDISIFRTIEDRKIPYVLIDRRFPDLDANYVGADDEEIGRLATEHLVARGCRRIAHVAGPRTVPGLGREHGYKATLAERGLPFSPQYVEIGLNSDVTGHAAMKKLLKLNPRPDGVFCCNDPAAAGALRAILEAGLRVPEDIAVVGAGNISYSDLFRVPLTTVDQNSRAMGEKSADLLLDLLGAKRPRKTRQIVLPPHLIARASSGA